MGRDSSIWFSGRCWLILFQIGNFYFQYNKLFVSCVLNSNVYLCFALCVFFVYVAKVMLITYLELINLCVYIVLLLHSSKRFQLNETHFVFFLCITTLNAINVMSWFTFLSFSLLFIKCLHSWGSLLFSFELSFFIYSFI